MSEILTKRPCPVCDSTSYRAIWSFNEIQFYTDRLDRHNIVEVVTVVCRDCYAAYQNPVPTTAGFEILYEKAAASYGSTEGRPAEIIDWLNHRGLLREVSLVFDVGCYSGDFLALLPPYINRSGVDFDLSAIKLARKRDPKGTYIHSSFENLEMDNVIPNLITMFHVLEHVVNPQQVLKRLLAISSKETRLVLEVPLFENAPAGDINGFFSTTHLTHFSRNTLERLVLSSGWVIEEWFEQIDYNGTRLLCIPGETKASQNLVSKPDISDVGIHYRYVSRWLDSVADATEKFSQALQWDNLVIWGGGMHTEVARALGVLAATKNLLFIVDSDLSKHGHHWRGIEICSTRELMNCDWQSTGLLLSSYHHQEEIAGAATSLGVPIENLIRLYSSIEGY